VAATRVGVIAEGPIDEVLISALLQRIAQDRANFTWPAAPDDLADYFPVRKRGHGGVVDTVRRLVELISLDPSLTDYAFFVIVLDQRTIAAQREVRRAVGRRGRFVRGVAVKEIEAWWLGDRRNTLNWAHLTEQSCQDFRYGRKKYRAEKDDNPKRTLDELTRQSGAIDSCYGDGNLELAVEFAETWRDHARLGHVEAQCPQGFRPFCRKATNAFRRAKAANG